jgi:hypothetical protein
VLQFQIENVHKCLLVSCGLLGLQGNLVKLRQQVVCMQKYSVHHVRLTSVIGAERNCTQRTNCDELQNLYALVADCLCTRHAHISPSPRVNESVSVMTSDPPFTWTSGPVGNSGDLARRACMIHASTYMHAHYAFLRAYTVSR